MDCFPSGFLGQPSFLQPSLGPGKPSFPETLAWDLFTFDLSPSTVLQDVDDLLLCSSSPSVSQPATSLLLSHLGALGFCVSPLRLSCALPLLCIYLGFQFSPRSKTLTSYRVRALWDLQPPTTANQIFSFFVPDRIRLSLDPNLAVMANPLHQAARETPTGPLTHPATIHCHFSLLWDALVTDLL